jgi:hypothetical protein
VPDLVEELEGAHKLKLNMPKKQKKKQSTENEGQEFVTTSA